MERKRNAGPYERHVRLRAGPGMTIVFWRSRAFAKTARNANDAMRRALVPHSASLHAGYGGDYSGLKVRATPLMQARRCVGGGPSSNTWPRWRPHRLECTSVGTMRKPLAPVASMEAAAGAWTRGR